MWWRCWRTWIRRPRLESQTSLRIDCQSSRLRLTRSDRTNDQLCLNSRDLSVTIPNPLRRPDFQVPIFPQGRSARVLRNASIDSLSSLGGFSDKALFNVRTRFLQVAKRGVGARAIAISIVGAWVKLNGSCKIG